MLPKQYQCGVNNSSTAPRINTFLSHPMLAEPSIRSEGEAAKVVTFAALLAEAQRMRILHPFQLIVYSFAEFRTHILDFYFYLYYTL